MRVIYSVILISVFVQPLNAQQTYINNTYEFAGDWDGATSVLETDSGYILSGETGSGGLDGSIALLFIDKSGNTISKKSYGSAGLDFYGGVSGSLTKTLDGGLGLGGSFSISSGISVGLLWKFYANGDTAWTKRFGDSIQYFEAFYQCKQTPDSGFILIGATDEPDSGGNTDIWLVKTDKDGNFEWDTTYGGGGLEYGFNVELTPDGGYILGGYTESFGAGDQDTYIIKTDSLGALQWSKTYGGIYMDCSARIFPFSDGSYMVTSCEGKYILSGSYTQRRIIAMKIDSAGDTIWKKEYGPARLATSALSIHRLQDSSFVIAGQSNNNKGTPNGNGWPIGFVLKISSQGDSLWYRIHEYDTCAKNDDYIRDMKPTSDGGFITAGFFTPNTSFQCNDTGTQDMWVMKLDSCGCSYPQCDPEPVAAFSYTVDSLTFTFTNQSDSTNMYWWDFGDNSFSNDTNTTHSYQDTGVYIVTLVARNCSRRDTVKDTIVISFTGINENTASQEPQIQVYPNPATNQITITGNFTEPATIILYDIMGRAVMERMVTNGQVNISRLNSGLYFYKITAENTPPATGKLLVE